MDNRIQKAGTAYITSLTRATAVEIQEYAAEVRDNRKFHDGIIEKRDSQGRRTSGCYYGISETLGTVLYIICRKQKPDSAMETGVASGVSSHNIPCPLERNDGG